ncbi:hypothetical protein B0T10DRAFT_78815 [Thelonectria olida]|uniref:Uncharacterized protein n=1 Tax=Thelonectria olida TaxID=1576542 RepID=A0A9P8W2I7_9HYPO|nr:hypothetical protein B0T10DRAFT_78815 [Thelonectria olida]
MPSEFRSEETNILDQTCTTLSRCLVGQFFGEFSYYGCFLSKATCSSALIETRQQCTIAGGRKSGHRPSIRNPVGYYLFPSSSLSVLHAPTLQLKTPKVPTNHRLYFARTHETQSYIRTCPLPILYADPARSLSLRDVMDARRNESRRCDWSARCRRRDCQVRTPRYRHIRGNHCSRNDGQKVRWSFHQKPTGPLPSMHQATTATNRSRLPRNCCC